MTALKAALATIHRDHAWWRKVLIGGALWLTIVGALIVEGYQIESMENTRQGYPTPLPRWNDLGTKAVQGLFALVIDFFFFLFPLFGSAILVVCGLLALGLLGANALGLQAFSAAVGALILGWLGFAWLSSASPVAKQLYVGEGQPNQALSGKVLRTTWTALARPVYLRARLQSLPIYLLPIALFIAAWQSANVSGWLALTIVWLAFSSLLYARLVTIQLYDSASRDVQRRKFEAFRARVS